MFRKLCQNAVQSRCILSVLMKQSLSFYSTHANQWFLNSLPAQLQWRYCSQLTKINKKNSIVEIESSLDDNKLNQNILEFKKIFQCTDGEAAEVNDLLSKQCENINISQINKTVKWLKRLGATLPILIKNCHILLIPKDVLKKRYERLNRCAWYQFDDYVPLLAVEEDLIKHFHLKYGYVIRTRIYLLNDYFPDFEPHIISHYCAKKFFVIEMEVELLKRKLDLLQSYGVSGENIFRDLCILARSEEVIKEKAEFLKNHGIERIKPWMIKCEKRILERTLNARNQRAPHLNRTLELLAERLNWHGNTATSMFRKYKFLRDLNKDMASQRLDELLKCFSPDEITANMKLMSFTVEHISIRVAELLALKNANNLPKELNIEPKMISLSKKKFDLLLSQVFRSNNKDR